MILITGGLGFIGSHTTKALVDMGEECIVTSHQNKHIPTMLQQAQRDGKLTVEEVDITDATALQDLGNKYDITHIIHLAAPRIGTLDVADDLRMNLDGLFTIIAAARSWKVRRLVVASSIGVYGGLAGPLREDAPLSMRETNPIAANKKAFEVLGSAIASKADIDIVFVRPSAIWGPGGRPRSIFFSLPQLVHAAVNLADSEVQAQLGDIYANDGIDMCYVKDCGRAIGSLTVAPQLTHTVYNVGSGQVTTNQQIVAAIQAIVPNANLTLLPGNASGVKAERWYQDISRLTEDIDFRPAYDLQGGIADYITWVQAENGC